MGFFSKLFAKPKSLAEELAEQHPTSWYESKATSIFSKVFGKYDEEGEEAAINLFCLKYFESFDNVTQLRAQGVEIDTAMIAKEFTCYIKRLISEQTETAYKVFYAGQVFKEGKSPFVRFIKKLNHNFYGQTTFYISELIFLGYIDVDKHEWLYDKALFAFDAKSDDENGTGLFEKIGNVLSEKGLLTDSIIAEIQETMQ